MELSIRKRASQLSPSTKQLLKFVARQTIGKLPPPKGRLTGKLAVDGGKAVRDTRFRPWGPPLYSERMTSWLLRVRPRLRDIFLSGAEGLPQPLETEFIRKWTDYCCCRYGLLVPHGTDALRIALAATLDHDGLDYGGEIIVPNISFIASATAALDRRFGVVFVDVERDTLLIDPKRVEEAIIPGKTRAIMAVHLFGQPANMTALRDIANRYDLKIIEDAAQAHGAAWETGPVGSLGDAAGFSFQSSKNLSCGEGGALTTNDEQIFERAYLIHDAGRQRVGRARWAHVSLGWNCHATAYQAVLLLERLRVFGPQQERRERNVAKLREMLADVACVEPLSRHPKVRKDGIHMFVMRYHPEYCGGLPLPDFLRVLQAEGVPIHRGYDSTIAQQPVMQKLMDRRAEYFRQMPTPVADEATKELAFISHDVFLGTAADMTELAAALKKVQNHYSPTATRPKPCPPLAAGDPLLPREIPRR
jgi:dTDP-4-amino-4,6-dideoxygalactose transaminase